MVDSITAADYPTVDSLILGVSGEEKTVPSIARLSLETATVILDQIDPSKIIDQSTNNKRPTSQAVIDWAVKMLSLTPMPQEDPEIINLLLEKIQKEVETVRSFTAQSESQEQERNIELVEINPFKFCYLNLHKGFRSEHADLSFSLYFNDGDWMYYEAADDFDDLNILKNTDATEADWEQVIENVNNREKQRSLAMNIGVTDFSYHLKSNNCEVTIKGIDKIDAGGRRKEISDDLIEGVDQAPIEVFDIGAVSFGNFETGIFSRRIECDVMATGEDASFEFIVTANFEQLVPFILLNEPVFDGERGTITQDQILGFFKRWIGKDTVNQINMDFPDKIQMLKKIAAFRLIEKSKMDHKDLYQSLGLAPGEILLAYAKALPAEQEKSLAQ